MRALRVLVLALVLAGCIAFPSGPAPSNPTTSTTATPTTRIDTGPCVVPTASTAHEAYPRGTSVEFRVKFTSCATVPIALDDGECGAGPHVVVDLAYNGSLWKLQQGGAGPASAMADGCRGAS